MTFYVFATPLNLPTTSMYWATISRPPWQGSQEFQVTDVMCDIDTLLTHGILAQWIVRLSQSLLQWISNFGESNTLVDFDPILAHKCSMANAASNAATFLHAFSISFAFGFGFGILVQKCTVFEYVFWLVYLGLKTSVWDLSIKSQRGNPFPKPKGFSHGILGTKCASKIQSKPLPKDKGIWIRFWEPNPGLQAGASQDMAPKSWYKSLCIHIQILIGFQMWVLFPKYHRTSLQSLGKDLPFKIWYSNPEHWFSIPNMQAKIHV